MKRRRKSRRPTALAQRSVGARRLENAVDRRTERRVELRFALPGRQAFRQGARERGDHARAEDVLLSETASDDVDEESFSTDSVPEVSTATKEVAPVLGSENCM